MVIQKFTSLFHLDALAIIMITLVAFIGICVGSFSYRYMKGDKKYKAFFIKLGLMVVSIIVTVSANHLALLLTAWCISNLLLVQLMIHKNKWRAARNAGILAAKNYVFSAITIATSFFLLYHASGETSIQAILYKHSTSPLILPALILLLISAMSQSAIWPLHKWLASSLNSPTPVSAIMHAGMVNGGGFLLTRFAPLYLKHSTLLTAIFMIGLLTALLGTLWKLMQSDVKRMLACSTIGQMGFMLAQCGLGLFPSAVAHLVWHGLFKSYLFLASGNATREKRFDLDHPSKPTLFIPAIICGMAGSIGFAYASRKSWFSGDTTLVIMIVAFLTASQFALPILYEKTLQKLPIALIATTLVGLACGGSLYIINWAMEPMDIMQPQPLNAFHIACIIALTIAWLFVPFLRYQNKTSAWMIKNYVKALNASQPHPTTVTAYRNSYQYK